MQLAGDGLVKLSREPQALSVQSAQVHPSLNLDDVLAQAIDWQFKSFPVSHEPVRVSTVGDQGWNALEPPFQLPIMVIKDQALGHNIKTMAEYARARSVSLAPHAKTPLSPQIAARQLAAGAWGLTVANVHQARVLRSVGAQRLLLANEVVDQSSAVWLAQEINKDPGLEMYCLVDSIQGARLLNHHLAGNHNDAPLRVLIELGMPEGRCGCRTVDEACELAAAVAGLQRLRLVGVEGYEGVFPVGSVREATTRVDRFFDELRKLANRLDSAGLFQDVHEILVTGGGSIWFDRAAARLTEPWDLTRPVRTVIRAGSYVTHDSAEYERLSPLDGRATGSHRLRQALELWAEVISRPEADLAVLNFGKRDAAHDRGFPIPFIARTSSGDYPLKRTDHEMVVLNDQHARMRLPTDSPLAVGDLVGSHVSHPCTSFDKWRLVPLVDDSYDVIGAIRSYL
jgi:D-serine deaminase-like pyridoxal phosphate-dependent protein